MNYSFATTLSVLFFTFCGMIFGFAKGFKKSILSLITVILAALGAFFLSPPIAKLIVNEKTVQALFQALEPVVGADFYEQLSAASPSTMELIIAVGNAIIALVVFIVLFFVLKLLLRIPRLIIGACFFSAKTHKEPIPVRFIGVPLGALQGFISVMVTVVVLAGVINIADRMTNEIMAQPSDSKSVQQLQADCQKYQPYLDALAKDPIIQYLCKDTDSSGNKTDNNTPSPPNQALTKTSKSKENNALSRNFVFDSLTTFRVNGEAAALTTEIHTLTQAYVSILPLNDEPDMANWGDIQYSAMENFLEKLSNSKIVMQIGSEMLSGACQAWSEGQSFLGLSLPLEDVEDDTTKPILQALLVSLSKSTSETLKDDLHTIADMSRTLNKHQILRALASDNPDLMVVMQRAFLKDFLPLVSKSDRFNVIIPEVTNVALDSISKSLNMDLSNVKIPSGSCRLSENDITHLSEGFGDLAEFIREYQKIEGEITLDNIEVLNLALAGQALDHLKVTSLLSNKVDILASAFIQSVIPDTAQESLTDKLASGNFSYEALFNTVQSTSSVLKKLNNASATPEEKKQAVVDLLNNITPETSEVINEIVNEDFLKAQGVPEKYASSSTTALKTVLKEMASLEEDEHEKEIDGIQKILEISTIVNNEAENSKELVGENGIFESTDELITIGVESKVASKTLKDLTTDKDGNKVTDALGIASTLTEEQKEEATNELKKYYENNATSLSEAERSELADKLDSIATLLDIPLDLYH